MAGCVCHWLVALSAVVLAVQSFSRLNLEILMSVPPGSEAMSHCPCMICPQIQPGERQNSLWMVEQQEICAQGLQGEVAWGCRCQQSYRS